MTLEQVKQLSYDGLFLTIAKLCGWSRMFKNSVSSSGFSGDKDSWEMPSDSCDIPDYIYDSNACRNMFKENPMTQEQEDNFTINLVKLMKQDNITDIPHPACVKFWYVWHAIPRQLCEAFVMTMTDESGKKV